MTDTTLLSARPWARPRFFRSKRFTRRAHVALVYFLLVAAGIVVLFPLFWAVTTSVKELDQALAFPPVWIPNPVRLDNYRVALGAMNFLRYLRNTVIITAVAVVGQLISCSLAGYGFARFRFAGRDALFVVALSTLMLPSHILIIPRFVMFRYLGWLDTFYPLTVPTLFAGALNLFLMRQFIMTLPFELDEAARIDGCGYWGVFTRLILPLSKPALGIISVFTFMTHWRDFLGPLIYLSSERNYTLALGLNQFRTTYFVEWNYLMAAAVTVIIPPVIVFFLAQRYFIQGIVFTGLKG